MPLEIVAVDTFTGSGTSLDITLNGAVEAGDYVMLLATLRVSEYDLADVRFDSYLRVDASDGVLGIVLKHVGGRRR